MQKAKRGVLVALLTFSSGVAQAAAKHKVHLPVDYAQWTLTARCESGGWQVLGHAYPDALGLTARNWIRFGGSPEPIGPVSMAHRILEIRVADRFRAAYHAAIPDQDGHCRAW